MSNRSSTALNLGDGSLTARIATHMPSATTRRAAAIHENTEALTSKVPPCELVVNMCRTLAPSSDNGRTSASESTFRPSLRPPSFLEAGEGRHSAGRRGVLKRAGA